MENGQPAIVHQHAGQNGGHWIVVDSRVKVNGQTYYNVRDPNVGRGVRADILDHNMTGQGILLD